MPGPTGENNELRTYGRGCVLCLGPTLGMADEQAEIAKKHNSSFVIVAPEAKGRGSISGVLSPKVLTDLRGIDLVAYQADNETARDYRRALAARNGAIVPLVVENNLADYCIIERHICTDTTAAGGNTTLLAGNG